MKDADLTLPGEIKIAMLNIPVIFPKNWTLVLNNGSNVHYHLAIFPPDISKKVLEKWKFFNPRGTRSNGSQRNKRMDGTAFFGM